MRRPRAQRRCFLNSNNQGAFTHFAWCCCIKNRGQREFMAAPGATVHHLPPPSIAATEVACAASRVAARDHRGEAHEAKRKELPHTTWPGRDRSCTRGHHTPPTAPSISATGGTCAAPRAAARDYRGQSPRNKTQNGMAEVIESACGR